MRNFDIGHDIPEEPTSYNEFQKAVDLIGLVVVDEIQLARFKQDLDALILKGQSIILTPEEVDALEKGKKDITKLVKKQIVTKTGVTKTVYVKAGDNKPNDKDKSSKEYGNQKSGKAPEKHAEDTRTHKLEKYVKEGKDEGLKKIAKTELSKRKKEKADTDSHNDNPVVGKTKSGKFIFHDHDNGGHDGFTSKDHEDAAHIHGDKKVRAARTSAFSLETNNPTAKHHAKQESIHAKLANKMRSKEAVKKTSDNNANDYKLISKDGHVELYERMNEIYEVHYDEDQIPISVYLYSVNADKITASRLLTKLINDRKKSK